MGRPSKLTDRELANAMDEFEDELMDEQADRDMADIQGNLDGDLAPKFEGLAWVDPRN